MTTKKPTLEESLGGLTALTSGAALPLTSAAKAPKAPKEITPHVPELDDGELLTAAEKAAIEKEVADELAAEARADAAADYKAKLKAEMIRKSIKHAKDADGDDVVDLTIDVARTVPYIRLDNVVYYPGYRYTVTRDVAKVLLDQMHRSYVHDAEISGLNINDYMGRRQALSVISPRQQ